MADPTVVIDAMPDQVRYGLEHGYRWLVIFVDAEFGKDFPEYARDEAELGRLQAEATADQYIASEFELTGSAEEILKRLRPEH
ncbi:hypothetical protein BBF93_06720 [Hyphomonas sp. CACIAM 19H1]|uniref:hypothetical protein n=1 Tax=Hyphomonas sp. CACIAM 19H1 TaxID=1873716 RepID=UPI000DED3A15|nr:hypothetical protein [Hyphomonas sp. CACIAM 19H1]AXE63944.1 hypothetical protein BBF93_06720 [Hyphomonas sp. CACIAM 19H1]